MVRVSTSGWVLVFHNCGRCIRYRRHPVKAIEIGIAIEIVRRAADKNLPSLSERALAQRVGEEFGEAGPREAGGRQRGEGLAIEYLALSLTRNWPGYLHSDLPNRVSDGADYAHFCQQLASKCLSDIPLSCDRNDRLMLHRNCGDA